MKQLHLVKGQVKFCLVIKLTMVGNWAVILLPMFATRYVLLLPFIPIRLLASDYYPQKMLIFDAETDYF